MISANGGLPAHRYTPQVTQRWPRGSEPASGGGGWLPVVGGGNVIWDVVPEVAQGGRPGYPNFALPLFGVAGGGAGWGLGHVGLAVAGAALGVLPLWHGVSD